MEFYPEDFQAPYEVGCRILVLWAVSYLSYNLKEIEEVELWLKKTSLWDKVSKEERKLFTEELPDKKLIDFSWNIEALLVLCWAVNLLAELPDLDKKISGGELDALMNKLPIDENPDYFLSKLEYRNKEDIFIENVVNEMITSYFRDIWLSTRENEFSGNSAISFERHYALNWVRQFDGISEWDETDTST